MAAQDQATSYARVVRLKGDPNRVQETITVWTQHILPLLKKQRGFTGVTLVGNRKSGDALTVSYWETEATMKEARGQVRPQALKVFGEIGASIIEDDEYEVALLERFKPPMAGAWARLTTFHGDPARVSEAVDNFKDKIVPVIATQSGARTALVPLVLRGRPFGTLAVANPVGGAAFDEDAVRLLGTFADQASVALEYGRAQREMNRLSVLDERERIGRELHDGVIQSLFSVGMGLQATATRSRDPEVELRVEAAIDEIDRAIRDLRNYIFGLRPGILADRQLEQALQDLAHEFEEKTGVTTMTDIDGTVAAELAPRATDLVQLTREALSNVGRHAEAATCRVSLHREGEDAVLEIDDDGQGFDSAAPQTGQGLRNLKDRGIAIGGRVAVESKAGEGTTVQIAIPI